MGEVLIRRFCKHYEEFLERFQSELRGACTKTSPLLARGKKFTKAQKPFSYRSQCCAFIRLVEKRIHSEDNKVQ